MNYKAAGTCKHRPISNGWGQRYSLRDGVIHAATAWCGFCKAHVEIDAEWIAKFIAHGRSAPELPTPAASP